MRFREPCGADLSRVPLTGMFRRTTLATLLERYRDTVTIHKRGSESERARITALLRHPLAARPLSRIKPPDLAGYRDGRLCEVSAASVRRELVLLAHVFEIARREWGYAITNPVKEIRRPPDSVPRERRLERDRNEAARLLAACRAARSPWLAPIVEFALETAMRRGELLALEWRHVDLGRCTAYLPQTKTGVPRTVPLSPHALKLLRGIGPGAGRVFAGVTPEAVKQAFRRATRRAGLTDLRFHDLRHEATSRLFERGLNVMEVAAITGHKDPRMLARYTHLRAEDLARKLGSLK